MPTPTVKLAALALLAAAPIAAQPPAPADPGYFPPAKALVEKAKSDRPTLEDILAAALRNNPDIRVAEAKLREAEAELNRVRLAVIQKVTRLYPELQQARAQVAQAEAKLGRLQKLHESKAVSAEMLDEAQADLAKAKANLARLEAELPYVLGPQAARKPVGELLTDDLVLCHGIRHYVQGQPLENCMVCHTPTVQFLKGTRAAVAGAPVKTPLTEAVRQALDKTVTLNVPDREVALKEVLAGLAEAVKAGGGPEVNFWPQYGVPDGKMIRLPRQSLPLGAYLLALEDLAEARFIVREYGILVTSRAAAPPPGAQSLREFWQGGEKK